MSEPTVKATRYEVTCIPGEGVNAHGFTLRVEYRGRDRWAVTDGHRCLSSSGEWSYESIPSEREDEWLETHRFDLNTALRLAVEAAPKVTVNGYTVADALAMAAKRGES